MSSFAVIMYKQWPLHAPVLNYREFQYLQHLKFILPCFNSNLLVNMLKKCRRLQVLIIQSNMVCLLLKFKFAKVLILFNFISLPGNFYFSAQEILLLCPGKNISLPREIKLHRRKSSLTSDLFQITSDVI